MNNEERRAPVQGGSRSEWQRVPEGVLPRLAERGGFGVGVHPSRRRGASLRAVGWRSVGECGGGSWSRDGRPRVDTHPLQVKIKWEAS
jgi:hypothetical protein